MAPKIKITDDDRKMKKIARQILSMNGMSVRSGVLSGKPKYPQDARHKGIQVAAVAGIHHVGKILGAVFDERRTEIDAKIQKVMGEVIDGKKAAQAAEKVLEPYRDEVRDRVPYEYGLLSANVQCSVYNAKGKWVAGDPKDGIPG
jgi:hypothetical protein